MTMPSSGPITFSEANTELSQSATGTISMNDANVRSLAGVGGSGTSWAFSSLYGKSAYIAPSGSLNGAVGSTTGGPTNSILTSGAVGVAISNGQAPFTYAWSITSSGGLISTSVNNPTGSTTTFSADNTATGSRTLSIKCVVTDAHSSRFTAVGYLTFTGI